MFFLTCCLFLSYFSFEVDFNQYWVYLNQRLLSFESLVVDMFASSRKSYRITQFFHIPTKLFLPLVKRDSLNLFISISCASLCFYYFFFRTSFDSVMMNESRIKESYWKISLPFFMFMFNFHYNMLTINKLTNLLN